MGWNEAPFAMYRKSETYLLKLMKLRVAEPPGAPFDTVDALFDDGKKPAKAVKFVNDEGKFEPGKTSAAELRKLPDDAARNTSSNSCSGCRTTCASIGCSANSPTRDGRAIN